MYKVNVEKNFRLYPISCPTLRLKKSIPASILSSSSSNCQKRNRHSPYLTSELTLIILILLRCSAIIDVYTSFTISWNFFLKRDTRNLKVLCEKICKIGKHISSVGKETISRSWLLVSPWYHTRLSRDYT